MTTYELEWLNRNRHRNYPLADGVSATGTTTGKTIPSSFMCDMSLNVPPLSVFESGTFYISRIDQLTEAFQIVISFQPTEDQALDSFDVFRSVSLNYTTPENNSVTLFPIPEILSEYPEMEQASGVVIIGSTDGMRDVTGEVFKAEATAVHPLVVHTGYAGLWRMVIIDAKGVSHNILGDLTIASGDGVKLNVEKKENGDYKLTVATEENGDNVDDAVRKVIDVLGIPITKINNVPPDSEGNITITGLDCTKVVAAGAGLAISNSCSKPCCPEETPADVQTALASLDEAKNRLINYHEALLNSLQTMQSRLASLIASRG